MSVRQQPFPYTYPQSESHRMTCIDHTGIIYKEQFTQNCTKPVTGQYLSIHIKTNSYAILTLCEVEVFGTLGK